MQKHITMVLGLGIVCLVVWGWPAAVEARVVYVAAEAGGTGSGADWVNACVTLTAGLAAAASGDEVWVRNATYPEAITMKADVALYGGFQGHETVREARDWTAAATVIDATGKNTSAVVGANGAVLDGFTVTGGSANHGGGVLCQSAAPTLRHCIFRGNHATDAEGGGGVLCFQANAVIVACTFTANTGGQAGAGLSCVSSQVQLSDCAFVGNVVDYEGGGLYCAISGPTVTNCVFSGNVASGVSQYGHGGAISAWFASAPQVAHCTFLGNSATDGGGALYCEEDSAPAVEECVFRDNASGWSGGAVFCNRGGSPTLTNCLLDHNYAEDGGGGLHCETGTEDLPTTARLINCTLVDNAAQFGGGTYCRNTCTLIMTNCILWNHGDELGTSHASSLTANYCCIQGGWPGTGNLDAYPLFVDPVHGDFRLRNGSPCLDRGALTEAPPVDLAGNLRPGDDGLVDMGAYESPADYAPGPGAHVPGTRYVDGQSAPGGDGSSWAEAFPRLDQALSSTSTGDQVWVKAGTYNEAVFLEPQVGVFGGFDGTETELSQRNRAAHSTIIDATGLHFRAVTGADLSRLDGFTLTNGDAIRGGGISCHYMSPLLSNLVIINNSATRRYGEGGGVYCFGITALPILANCVIAGNRANSGGGLNCGEGAGPILINCTVTGNSGDGSGIFSDSSSPLLTNCIVWGNGEGPLNLAGGQPHFGYCDIETGFSGPGNIDTDPLFQQPWTAGQGNLHLQLGSPCIDTATPAGAPDTDTDLDGLPRPYDVPGVGFDGPGQGYDMGAYEYHPAGFVTPTPTATPVEPTATPTPVLTPSPTFDPRRADLNHDGVVDEADLLILTRQWHQD